MFVCPLPSHHHARTSGPDLNPRPRSPDARVVQVHLSAPDSRNNRLINDLCSTYASPECYRDLGNVPVRGVRSMEVVERNTNMVHVTQDGSRGNTLRATAMKLLPNIIISKYTQ
ncbi:hypothetical protein J6590_096058 [Homalodisca vitripennis]|nr:hypothetical protein J6590_096058 [Homalodisca vitripennis]